MALTTTVSPARAAPRALCRSTAAPLRGGGAPLLRRRGPLACSRAQRRSLALRCRGAAAGGDKSASVATTDGQASADAEGEEPPSAATPAAAAPPAEEQEPAEDAEVAAMRARIEALPKLTGGDLLDEEELLRNSAFPIAPEELIARTQAILACNNGASAPEMLAEDFQFVGPVVGPLGKEAFLRAFSSFDVYDAFPDLQGRFHHFRVDPLEPSRCWYTSRAKGTHSGTLANLIPATGKLVDTPPQACSMKFNEEGLCTQLTIGYVMDRNLGNTGGVGGVYGLFYAVGAGLPFPEAQPWQRSPQYELFVQAGGVLGKLMETFNRR